MRAVCPQYKSIKKNKKAKHMGVKNISIVESIVKILVFSIFYFCYFISFLTNVKSNGFLQVKLLPLAYPNCGTIF